MSNPSMNGDVASLRAELIAASRLCAAIFPAWPNAVPRLLDDERPIRASHSVDDLMLVVSWFPTGKPKGPAIGDPDRTTWGNFADLLSSFRSEGEKDGTGFVPARFKLEPDCKHVRRLGGNPIARTAVVLDCETNNKTGEVPPSTDVAGTLMRNAAWAGVIYTSHNHSAAAPRYRIVLPLAGEIDHELPAVEAVADRLGLSGVIDRSKAGANSPFYLPSANPGELDRHQTVTIDGTTIDTAWIGEAPRMKPLAGLPARLARWLRARHRRAQVRAYQHQPLIARLVGHGARAGGAGHE